LEAEASGDPAQLENAFSFISNIGMVYERMLLENAFVNELYQASDKYERDNFKLPLTENGRIVTDKTGQPQATTAYDQYQNEDGSTGSARVTADWAEARDRRYAESRATFAIMASLFNGAYLPGQAGSMWRFDQA